MASYLIDMLPFADGLLANCTDQLEVPELSDAIHFIAHYAPYVEKLAVYKIEDNRHFNVNAPLMEYNGPLKG